MPKILEGAVVALLGRSAIKEPTLEEKMWAEFERRVAETKTDPNADTARGR